MGTNSEAAAEATDTKLDRAGMLQMMGTLTLLQAAVALLDITFVPLGCGFSCQLEIFASDELAQISLSVRMMLATLVMAVRKGELPLADNEPDTTNNDPTDPAQASIPIEALKLWAVKAGHQPKSLFGANPVLPLLDPSHPRYSAELAFPVEVWLASGTDPKRSPKQQLTTAALKLAPKYGFTHPDGSPVMRVIDKYVTQANWQKQGGAPRSSE